MKTEKQVKEFRNDLYRSAVMLKQSGMDHYDIHELTIVMVRLMDWVLNDDDAMGGYKVMLGLFSQFEKDSKKLALF
jgi:hypothetical protein